MSKSRASTTSSLTLALLLGVSTGVAATEQGAGLATPLESLVPRTEGAPARPNVVVLYVDDVSPRTPWLWSDPERTPELARFASHGVEFSQAITSTPLCGPSRATLLTGRYSHEHRVEDNSMERFDPSRTIAPELQAAGYHTIQVGKYLNGLEDQAPQDADVQRYAEGWDHFDVIWKRQNKGTGQFYNYTLWSREGPTQMERRPGEHSTFVIGQRLARHIRQAPVDQPLYAVASLGSGHWPNVPFAWHRGDAACTDVRAYRSPSFNEPDVSDKPRFIRTLPRLEKRSFGLRRQCEEMLSVDRTLARITAALRATDRLDDTLLLFTSDNGYLLNDHRMPEPGGKKWPHALEVPLYALWPAALAEERRVVDEPVSNVDIPVTVCALAGCELPEAEGMDLTPLLTGEAEQLERRFLYTELLRDWHDMPPWYGLVTTGGFSDDAIWHYTEYGNGGRELYDLSRDPYRLRNLSRDPKWTTHMRKLHRLLHREVVRPAELSLR